MKEFELDTRLREMLHDCADEIHAEDAMKTRIDFAVHMPRPRRIHRRLMVGVAAAVCLTLMGALARGPVSALVSGMGRDDMHTTVSALRRDAVRMLDGVVVPEQLAGYDFEEGGVRYTDKLDASGNRLGRFPDVSAFYGKDGSRLSFSAHVWDAEVDADDKQADVVREVAGTAVSYRVDAYLFLPEGEAPTAGEQARMEAGELYISYGTDARESKLFQHVSFQIGDMVYRVHTFDAAVTENILFDAAAAVLTAAA